MSETVRFGFRPWVRNTCLRAMRWGIGVVLLVAAVTWWLQGPGQGPVIAPLGRAFGALFLYTGLFWATLLKVWWTARGAAVTLEPEALAYQPLHTFSPKRIPYEDVLVCAPRTQTSLRIAHRSRRDPDKGLELFLNLAVIQGRHEFLDALGERLEATGAGRVIGRRETWMRPGAESILG